MRILLNITIVLIFIPRVRGQAIDEIRSKADRLIVPSKYATVLYADQVSDQTGNNKLVASHFQSQGGGSFSWKKNIPNDGSYEIAISYASAASAIDARLSAGGTVATTAKLGSTTGYYPLQKGFELNFERKKWPGKLRLVKGTNTITLQLTAPDSSEIISLYSIELIPVDKLAAIEKDRPLPQKLDAGKAWFANSGYGVMFHWTSQSTPEHGLAKPYAKAVSDFDVDAFVKMVEKTGAAYVIMTTNHAEPYFPAPLKSWETAYPGHTTSRDLVEEIANGLQHRHIRLFLYLASHVYAKYDSTNDEEFNRLNYTLVKEIGERYKTKVAGYWFDGWYQCYEKHPQFDFEKFYGVCKAGNPERLVTLNTWLYPVNTLWQDFWAGEVYTIGSAASRQVLQNGPGKGLQSHNLIVMEKENWYHDKLNTKIPHPDLKADQLTQFILRSKGKGPITINIQIYQDGRISDEALSLMEQLKKSASTNLH